MLEGRTCCEINDFVDWPQVGPTGKCDRHRHHSVTSRAVDEAERTQVPHVCHVAIDMY